MPKFNVTVTFDLVTEIEPAYFTLGGLEDAEGVSNLEDSSYWSRKEIRSDGGTVTFQVEAEDEDAVEQLVHEYLREDMEIEDNDSVTWMIGDCKVEIEQAEEPMTKDKAKDIVRLWLAPDGSPRADWQIPAEVREALLYLLEIL